MNAVKPDVVIEPRVVGPGFRADVSAVVSMVPVGRLTTYGDVAGALGSRRVARQVGFALAALTSTQAKRVPWHRVINGKGSISARGETERAEIQAALLIAEGVLVENGVVVDFGVRRIVFPPPYVVRELIQRETQNRDSV